MVIEQQNWTVGGARCVTAIVAVVETSHVADRKAARPAERCVWSSLLTSIVTNSIGRIQQAEQYKESK